MRGLKIINEIQLIYFFSDREKSKLKIKRTHLFTNENIKHFNFVQALKTDFIVQ